MSSARTARWLMFHSVLLFVILNQVCSLKLPSSASTDDDYHPFLTHDDEFTPVESDNTTAIWQAKSASTWEGKLIFVNAWAQKGIMPRRTLTHCPRQCTMTANVAEFPRADAVIWNPRWMTPIKDIPTTMLKDFYHKRFQQKWVFNFNFEAPLNRGNRVQEEAVKKLAPQIDWTMTYMHKSDFLENYGHFEPTSKSLNAVDPKDAGNASYVQMGVPNGGDIPHPMYQLGEARPMLLMGLMSNCEPKRLAYFHALAAGLPKDRVKLYGKCGEAFPCARGDSNCERGVFSRFKFYAAFENTLCDGYISEKPYRAWEHGMVPLVNGGRRGAADYEVIMDKTSFIHIDDYQSHHSLASHLIEVDQDTKKYQAYHDWRSRGHIVSTDGYCALCMELYKKPWQQKKKFTHVNGAQGLVPWFYADTCRA